MPGDGLLDCGVYFCPFGFIKEPDLKVPEYAIAVMRRPDLVAVTGHFWYGIHHVIPRDAHYVTLVRDPVERVISLFYYLKCQDRMSLEEFALNPPYKEIDNDQTRRIAGIDPEIGEVTDAVLDLAIHNLDKHFTVTGTIERLDETLTLLRDAFGWKRDVECLTRNVNPDRPRKESIDPETIAAIQRRNLCDLRLYQYVNRSMDRALARLNGSGALIVREMAAPR
jgi:hypothetical protein